VKPFLIVEITHITSKSLAWSQTF